MNVTADRVKELRQATGAGFLDCRKALEQTNGDMEKAVALLREQGLAKAAERAGRETSAGMVELYRHGEGRVGVMVEVNCETDFVARTDAFRHFAHEMALQIAANDPGWIQVEEVPEEVIRSERELARQGALADGKPEHVIGRIVEGKLEKFFEDRCLMRQPYIRDDSKTVEEVMQEVISATGENILVRRFARWSLGEELD